MIEPKEYVNSLNVRRCAVLRTCLFGRNVLHPAVDNILVPFQAFVNSLGVASLGYTDLN